MAHPHLQSRLLRYTTAALLATLWICPQTRAQSAPAEARYQFKAPAPVRVAYNVEGVIGSAYTGNAELVWIHDGKRYQSQLFIRKFGLTLQAWSSQGALGNRGLEPEVFTSKRLGQSEINARFQRTTGRVMFSAGTPDAALQTGAQDQLSVFMQLASLMAGTPALAGDAMADSPVALQAIGDRYAEQWSFKVTRSEQIPLPSGPVAAVKFTHEPTAERKQRLELWYPAGSTQVPGRIRITESNGDFLDLLQTGSANP